MKTHCIALLLLSMFVFSSCKEEKSGSEKELNRLREALAEKRKQVTDQKEIARLEAEFEEAERELKQVNGVSTGNALPTATTPVTDRSRTEGTATAGNEKAGQIKGNSVNMRSEASVQASKVGSFDNAEIVTVLETKQSGKSNEAILTKQIDLYGSAQHSGTVVASLPKGKAVVIESFQGNLLNVSYQHPQKGKVFAQINESDVESIENGTWYKVRRKNNQVGWVLENFIIVK